MTPKTLKTYQDKTVRFILSDKATKILTATLKARIPPEAVLCQIAAMATRIATYERLAEISTPLIDRPDVRKRLREAGYKLPARSEREY